MLTQLNREEFFSSPVCVQLLLPLRLLCAGLLFSCNAVMWAFFSKALRHCSSSARATVTTTASNFISSVSITHDAFSKAMIIWKENNLAANDSEGVQSLVSVFHSESLLFVSRPSWGGWSLERVMQLSGGWESLWLCVACCCCMDPRLTHSHRRRSKSTADGAVIHAHRHCSSVTTTCDKTPSLTNSDGNPQDSVIIQCPNATQWHNKMQL